MSGALRPELVNTEEKEEAIEQHANRLFGYDRMVVPNPEGDHPREQVCKEKHQGLCCKDVCCIESLEYSKRLGATLRTFKVCKNEIKLLNISMPQASPARECMFFICAQILAPQKAQTLMLLKRVADSPLFEPHLLADMTPDVKFSAQAIQPLLASQRRAATSLAVEHRLLNWDVVVQLQDRMLVLPRHDDSLAHSKLTWRQNCQ